MVLTIKVVPKSGKDEILGVENEELKVKVHAVPEKGKANQALIHFFSEFLNFPKSRIVLVSGEKSRHKKLLFKNIEEQDLLAKLSDFVT